MKKIRKHILAIGLAVAFAMVGSGTLSAAATGDAQTLTVAPSGMVSAAEGIYIADSSNHTIRLRSQDGTYKTVAGKENVAGAKDGKATSARFSTPWDIVAYKNGYAISDTGNNRIRLLKNKKVSTIASGQMNAPTGLAVGEKGELYIADTGNNRILVLDSKGKLKSYAGAKKAGCADGTLKSARFSEPTGLYYYKKALYVADSGNHRIVKISGSKVKTVAGSVKGIEGDADGKAKSARFSNPQGILWKNNVMYISDSGNGSVKKLENGKVTTILEAFSLKGGRTPAQPRGMVIKGKTLFIGDVFAEDLLSVKI